MTPHSLVHLHLLKGGSWPSFKIIWQFSWSMGDERVRGKRCLCSMKRALPIKHLLRLLLMTHQQGQSEKSVLPGPIDSLNQELCRSSALRIADWWCEAGSPWILPFERWAYSWRKLIWVSRRSSCEQIISDGYGEIRSSYIFLPSYWTCVTSHSIHKFVFMSDKK